MKRKKLGTSGIEVPIICLGTMTWGQQNTEEEAHAQLSYAIDERGLDFIDTAEIYPIPPDKSLQGTTETYIGNWLEKRGKRDDLIIATKVAAADVITSREIENPPRLNKKAVKEAIEGSLTRLKTDYVDLYQIHWPERSTNFFGKRGYIHNPDESPTLIEETLEAMGELISEGKIKYVGVSNETSWGVSEYLRLAREKDLPRIVSIQNQYSLINRSFEIGLAEFSMREEVGLLPYSVLSMGVLSGKYLGGTLPEGSRFAFSGRNSERYNHEYVQEPVQAYVELAEAHGIDPSQMAIAFAASREFTSSAIIGARTMEQLKLAIDAGEMELSEEILSEIEEIHKKWPDHQI